MHFFTDMRHIPPLFAFLAIVAEFCGGLGLILGLLGRVAAFGIFVNMIVAIAMVHSRVGFFMNWSGQQKGALLGQDCPLLNYSKNFSRCGRRSSSMVQAD